MDLLFIGVITACFAVGILCVSACDNLMRRSHD
jgi:hypothetical protein